MANNRDVILNIKATDQTGPALKKAQSAVERFASTQERALNRRQSRAAADAALAKTTANFEEATREAARLGAELDAINNWRWTKSAVDAPQDVANNFERAKEAARQAKIEMAAARNEVAGFRQAGGGFAAFEKSVERLGASTKVATSSTAELVAVSKREADAAAKVARAIRDEETAARELAGAQAALRDLQRSTTATGEELARAQQRVASAYNRVEDAAQKAARAQRQGDVASRITAAYASRNGRGPLGLRPYELQNLGYQVNDLITQIASGTSPMQAFAQQGGQIAQIFPKATMALLRATPVVATLGLVFGPLIGAMVRANTEADRLSAMERLLKRSGEAANYSAPQLAAAARAIDGMGASAKEANGAVTTFVTDAVKPEYLERFGKAAVDMAKVLEIDVKEAADKVSDTFTGNADAIIALDDELNFLTDTERKHVEMLRESKRDAEARTYAFEIFARKYGDTAEKMKGPWSTILSNFGQAWRGFGDWLLNGIGWDAIKTQLRGLLTLVADLTSRLPGIQRNARQIWASQHGQLDAEIRTQMQRRDRLAPGDSRRAMIDADLVRKHRERDTLNRRIAIYDQTSAIARGEPETPGADTTNDPPKPANTSTPGRSGADEAERLAKAQTEFLASLEAENAARAFQVSLIDKAEREQQILTALKQAELQAAEAGLELTSPQVQAIRESVGALYDAQAANEANRVIEQARLDLARARGEEETEQAFVARMTAANMKDASDEKKAAYAAELRQLYAIDAAKRKQAALEKAIADQTAIRTELQEQITFLEESGDLAGAAVLREQLAGVNLALAEAVDKIIEFYRLQAGPEAQAALLYWQNYKKGILAVSDQSRITGKEINQMLADGAVRSFDTFAQQLVETRNLFGSLVTAVRQFAAEFLRQIGQMIMQQIVFNIVSGMFGGGKSPNGGVGGSLAGLLNRGTKVPTKHTGGIVGGAGGGSKWVDPSVFLGAARYHSGGLVSGEVPIIAKRNEEVLTESDPRHRFNGGGAGGSVKVINVFDPADAFERGLATEGGERSVFNFFRANASTFKAILS